MRIASELTIKRDKTDLEAQPTSEIFLHGLATGKRVSGAVLEAAVADGDRYLLFLTEDVPHEDTLNIHLLGPNLELLDSALLGAPYSTGSFSHLGLRAPHTVAFHFIGETTWHIEVFQEPRRSIPFVADAPGVRHPFGFTRYFKVIGNPKPMAT